MYNTLSYVTNLATTILFACLLFLIAPSSVSARVLPYCPPLDDALYAKLVTAWYASAGIKDFVLDGFNFCGDENRAATGYLQLSSDHLSRLGLTYKLTLPATADKNAGTVRLSAEFDRRKIDDGIRKFESHREVQNFIERFSGELQKEVSLFVFQLTAGDYWLEYDAAKDEFPRYALPVGMKDYFPPLATFEKKATAAGCSLDQQSGITFLRNEYWNTISLYAKVDGECKRSEKYTPAVFEVEYPIKRDAWTRLTTWFKKLWH
jgi:hypothetical protein